jgi:hypothetical protein
MPPPNFQKVKNAQPPKRGKLNHITAKEANDDEHVLVGMVSLNSINTRHYLIPVHLIVS